MSYTLEALAGQNAINHEVVSRLPGVKLVSLQQKIWLIPLTGELTFALSNVSEVGKVQCLPELQSASAGVLWLAQGLSQSGKVAYLEAEFFGGVGGQASVGWQNGELIFQPRQAADAINQALHWLGVLRNQEHDEFDMIGLGRYRTTDTWAQQ